MDDISGKTFGHWYVLKPSDKFARGQATKELRRLWWIRCSCNLHQLLSYDNIVHGGVGECALCRERAEASRKLVEKAERLLVVEEKKLLLRREETGPPKSGVLYATDANIENLSYGLLFETETDYTGKMIGAITVLGPSRVFVKGHNDEYRFRYWWIKVGRLIKKVTIRWLVKERDRIRTKNGNSEAAARVSARSELNRIWNSIVDRCCNPDSTNYDNYGGRGISVQESWHDPEVFIEYVCRELGARPRRAHLSRIDNDKGYEEGNIKWETPSINSREKWRSEYKPVIEEVFSRAAVKHAELPLEEVSCTISFKDYTVTTYGNYSGVHSVLNGNYVVCTIDGVSIPLHRLVYFVFADQVNYCKVLHLNGNPMDNRIWNLITGSRSEGWKLVYYNYERKTNQGGVHLWWLSEEERKKLMPVQL